MDVSYTLQSLMAAWLVTAWLVLAGMVTHAAVAMRVAGVIRCCGVLLIFAPAVLVGAFEIYWMLVCSVAMGVSLITGLQKTSWGRLEDSRVCCDKRERASLRYTIGNIFCVTALSALAIALVLQTPALNLRAWGSLLLIAVAGSCISAGVYWGIHAEKLLPFRIAVVGLALGLLTISLSYFDWLLLSLHTDVGWPPDVTSLIWGIPGVPVPTLHPEWLWFGVSALATACVFLWSLGSLGWSLNGSSLRSGWRLIIAIGVLVLIAPPLGLSLMLLQAQDLPERVQDENAYREVAAISGRIANSKFESAITNSGDWEAIPLTQLAKSVVEIEADLNDLHQHLQRPISPPIDFSIDSMPIDDFSNFRTVARAFVARSRLRSGQRSAAVDSLSAVQLGVCIRRGGLLVQYMAGMAFSSVGLAELYAQRAAFDTPTREFVASELLSIAHDIEPLSRVLETERIWIANQGWHPHLSLLLRESVGESIVSVDVGFLERLALQEQTLMDLLATEMALQNYQSESGSPPESLEQLVPSLLTKVPLDLLAQDGRQLSYQLRDGGYVLYSVGVDGIDDNGTIKELQPGMMPLEGDLQLSGMYGSR